MKKRATICEVIKSSKGIPFTCRQLHKYLNKVGLKVGLYETGRYIYRLRQMGLLTQNGITFIKSGHRVKVWKCINRNFNTKGRLVGMTASIKRAMAASNDEFYLRNFKNTVSQYPREDISGVFNDLKRKKKLLAQKALVGNVNLYFKPNQ